jgi:hypothetical protein
MLWGTPKLPQSLPASPPLSPLVALCGVRCGCQIDLTLLKRLSLVDLRVATEIPIGLCVTILDAAQTMRFEKLGDLYATPTGDSAVPSGTVLSSLMGGGQVCPLSLHWQRWHSCESVWKGIRVGDRSRGRFAMPADFPLHGCSAYSHVHV